MKKHFFLLAILFMAMVQTAYSRSKILTDTVFSKVLNDDRAYTVYLPPSFDQDAGRTYPVLYLLHGMSQTNLDWAGRGHLQEVADRLIASGEAEEMVIIMPNAGGDIYKNIWNGYFDMPGWKYETFFYEEFLPHVEKMYRVKGDKRHRAVAGLSMGGGGATAYGLWHSDKFSAVYAMSALMSIPKQGAARFENPDDKLAILTRSVIEHSCIDFVLQADEQTKAGLRTVAWFVDCGDDDFLLDRNIEFFQAMRNAGIPCQFRVRDGGNDWEYWHSALYKCLSFVSNAFNR